MEKPNIHGFCDAGCKWQVPHKEDVDKLIEELLTSDEELEKQIDQINTIISNGIVAKKKFASYIGTSACGNAHPNTLTFDFVPLLVIVMDSSSTTGQGFQIMVNGCKSAYTHYKDESYNSVSWNDKSVSWYHASNAQSQFNQNVTYNYIAIG
jgi:hypothetical protein